MPPLNGDIWKYIAVAALGIGAGQFVPVLTSGAVTEADIRALKTEVAQIRLEVKSEAKETREYIREQLGKHEGATAHEGALRLLIQHGQAISSLNERVDP